MAEYSSQDIHNVLRGLTQEKHPLKFGSHDMRHLTRMVAGPLAADPQAALAALDLVDEVGPRMTCGKCQCKLWLAAAMVADRVDASRAKALRQRASTFEDVRGTSLRRVQDEVLGAVNEAACERGGRPLVLESALFPLMEPETMPRVPLDVPREFYWVLQYPGALAGMRQPYPGEERVLAIIQDRQIPFDSIVCLSSESPGYNTCGLSMAHATELEDLSHGSSPRYPGPEEMKVRQAVTCVVEELRSGRGVIVHCGGGRGRTGTVIGYALRSLGYAAKEVIDYLDRLHKARGKPGWPESDWQGDLVERW